MHAHALTLNMKKNYANTSTLKNLHMHTHAYREGGGAVKFLTSSQGAETIDTKNNGQIWNALLFFVLANRGPFHWFQKEI